MQETGTKEIKEQTWQGEKYDLQGIVQKTKIWVDW